ncbi:hypothetical protein SD81_006955 [Tolypothrix campylonemoides VB511288]|nr:hypothetical protein SD81_006955 [Tolypothrix campylonemoides VB511288]
MQSCDRTLKKLAIKLHYQLLVGETGMQILGTVALLLFGFYSHLAPRKFDGTSLLSMKPKVLYIARKANKNNVALLHIFLVCTVFYG